MKEFTENNLKEAINSLSNYERQTRRRIFFFSFLLIFIAMLILYFTANKINELTKESNNLTSRVNYLNQAKDSLNKILINLRAFSEFSTNWDSSDISLVDPNLFRRAMAAHEQLILLAQSEKLNPDISIRYYLKYKDQYPRYNRIKEDFKRNRVQNSLRRVGYRAIDIKSDSYRNGPPTNVIYYSSNISKVDLKVIAFALLRAGIDLKGIEPYSKKIKRRKPNSVEISGKKSLVDQKSLTVDDVINFTF